MAWSRVSRWEIQERLGDVVLTLRGDGAITPLLIKGWTAADLGTLLREVTTGTSVPGGFDAAAPPTPTVAPRPAPRAGRRKGRRRARGQVRAGWKGAATVTLLVVLG